MRQSAICLLLLGLLPLLAGCAGQEPIVDPIEVWSFNTKFTITNETSNPIQVKLVHVAQPKEAAVWRRHSLETTMEIAAEESGILDMESFIASHVRGQTHQAHSFILEIDGKKYLGWKQNEPLEIEGKEEPLSAEKDGLGVLRMVTPDEPTMKTDWEGLAPNKKDTEDGGRTEASAAFTVTLAEQEGGAGQAEFVLEEIYLLDIPFSILSRDHPFSSVD